MTDSKTATNMMANGAKAPTTQEAMFFFAIVKHTKNKADIDWDGVAQEQGFKNAEVAKVRFGQVKRKLGINSDPCGSKASPTKTPSPAKVTKTAGSRVGSKGKRAKKSRVKKEDSDSDDADTAAKNEYGHHEPSTPVKEENGNHNVDAQLQADIDAMINQDPF